MVYDKFPVALLSALSAEGGESTNAQIARYLLAHTGDLTDLSVKELAAACHVGTGTVSRFAKEMGFTSFADLRRAFAESSRSYERVEGATTSQRASSITDCVAAALGQVRDTVDQRALARLVDDLHSYEKVSAFGLLKAQAAALGLQVDLLMQGRCVQTCTALADQRNHIACAGSDELVVVFSYTASYFDAVELSRDLRRLDRPKIWMVCGERKPLPSFVADCLPFHSDLRQVGHPYQLQLVASMIAQEYAAS